MDMLASIFAANYAFYSNMQGRRPVFYAPVACHPSQVSQLLSAQNQTHLRGTPSSQMNFSSKVTEQIYESPDGGQKDKSTEDVKFSIERILKQKSDDPDSDTDNNNDEKDDRSEETASTDLQTTDSNQTFPWLQCTRYKPPKLPRLKKKESAKKRKLGRNPRVPFTQHQVAALEQKFRQTHYLSSMDVAELSTALNLTEIRVKIWFQNRRARERREREATQRNGLLPSKSSSNGMSVSVPSTPWSFPMYPTHPALAHYRDVTHASVSAFSPVTSSTS